MHTTNLRKVGGSVMHELLALCNPKAQRSKEEREWLNAKPTGAELI
jgi:hypothetical protein